MSNVRALASYQRACVHWPCTRLADAECVGSCLGALIGSGQSCRSSAVSSCFNAKNTALRRRRRAKTIHVPSGKYGSNTKQRHNAFRFNQFAVGNHMQSRAIEGPFKSLVSVSPATRHVGTGRHASKGMYASEPSSNPSIEGTCNIRLRRLSPAPHVKR